MNYPGEYKHVEGATDCENSFQQILAWLGECERHHPSCGQNEAPAITPTRLISIGDVQSQTAIRLVDSSTARDRRYLTLSYCWGDGVPKEAQTTQSNLKARCEAIEIDILPQTFKDAIHITRKLGIQYLWIDSICILQDSTEDWTHESAMMGQIYSSSYCTISASASSSGAGGCFTKFQSPAVEFELSTTSCDLPPQSAMVKVFKAPALDWEASFINGNPLRRRAWVFQERHLSRRVLHFTGKQLMWECRA
ncbi:heterokaryon incompatibility protein-domain-containing protein, partial [Leptodontidium sp. 2 PMI_412]